MHVWRNDPLFTFHLQTPVAGIAPAFVQPLKSELATIGETVTLECAVSGDPQPNIEW